MKHQILNAEKLYLNLLYQLDTKLNAANFQLVGLASGGAWIAERLAKDLKLPTYGVVNVSFHRDDYSEKGVKSLNSSKGMSTKIPFKVDGAHIILVDDVLDTGRTVRAALNELFDYGRPAKVDLAVLADRYRRQVPIDATFKGAKVKVVDNQILVLEKDGDKFAFMSEPKS